MAFTITYKKLFEVELRQNYCLNKGAEEFASLSADDQAAQLAAYRQSYTLGDDFTLVIPEETRRILAGHKMLCRMTSTGFFVGLEVEAVTGGFTPVVVPDVPLRLRFALRLHTPSFMNYTNLSLYQQPRTLHYFSNLRNPDGGHRTFPSLALDPPAYQSGTVYKAGDLVRRRNNATASTLALRDGNHARPPQDTTGSLVWKTLDGQGYVNGNDRVSLYPFQFTFAFPSSVSVLAARFVMVDPDGTTHEAGTATSSQPLQTAALDLRHLAPGRYRFEVIDQATDDVVYTEDVYLDTDLSRQQTFALIEIVHRDGNGAYRWLDSANRLRLTEPESTYVIPFLNRYTYWHYHFDAPPVHVPNPTDFDEINDREYVTKASLPLTKGFIILEDDEGKPLPNPMGDLIKPEGDRVFSEVFLFNH